MRDLRPGAVTDGASTEFILWAPKHESVALHLVHPEEQIVPMQDVEGGYFSVRIARDLSGWRYFFRVGDDDRPDPASRFQPEGVHGPSEVVADSFAWSDDGWRGIPLHEYVIYELHIGTFTREGTFDAAIAELQRLRDLGITAVEVMPVAQFPGERNWGYDGTYPNAVQNSYGGPDAFRRFVDAAHRIGLAVILDVVYNHLGPEGNYLGVYGPYFTDVYRTPWGDAINFDHEHSDEVRRYFSNNALQWFRDYHVDALRLDAVHAIIDRSAQPFLQELATEVREFGLRSASYERYLIAESDLNDPRLILPQERGGYGLDAQWADDFHHAMHVVLTGEQRGYYADYSGIDDVPKVLERGWLYSGQVSSYRKRRFGASTEGLAQKQFIFCIQNHDQVGNRAIGDRLAAHLDRETLKTALGFLLLTPYVPMLFMGEEFGEKAPFQYFTSHGDAALVEAVRKGRSEEFKAFGWEGAVPAPDAVETFERSKIDRARAGEPGAEIERFVRRVLQLRREVVTGRGVKLTAGADAASKHVWYVLHGDRKVIVAANFGDAPVTLGAAADVRSWGVVIASNDREFGGSGAAFESEDGLVVPARSLVAAKERR